MEGEGEEEVDLLLPVSLLVVGDLIVFRGLLHFE